MAMCALELLKGRGLLLKLRGLFFELSHLEENADGNDIKMWSALLGSNRPCHWTTHPGSSRVPAVAFDQHHVGRAIDDSVGYPCYTPSAVSTIAPLLKGDVVFTNFEATVVEKGQKLVHQGGDVPFPT